MVVGCGVDGRAMGWLLGNDNGCWAFLDLRLADDAHAHGRPHGCGEGGLNSYELG